MIEALPWHKEYEVFGIPKTLEPYPEIPVHELLYEAAVKYPKTGFIQGERFISYAGLKDHVDRFATALARLGLVKGDRVATLLPTSVSFVISDYAISRAGLVHIPASPLEPVAALVHKFKTGGPKAVICLDENLQTARESARAAGVEHIIVARLDDYSLNSPPPTSKISDALWMSELIAKTPPEPPDIKFDAANDLETLLFTGGTTGLPKGCMLTHRGTVANSLQNFRFMGGGGKLLAGAASVILGVPFFHSYGHVVMHTMTLMGMNQILVPDSRDTDRMVEIIRTLKPVIQIGVPTQFMKIAGDKMKNTGIIGMSGSAPLPPTAQKDFEKSSGGGIMEGYGLSEMGPVTHLNTSFLLRVMGGRPVAKVLTFLLTIPGNAWLLNRLLRLAGPRVVGTVLSKAMSFLVAFTGKKEGGSKTEKRGTIGIPYPDTEIRILDVNTMMPLSWDEVLSGKRGELLLRGPQAMTGYWPTPGTGKDGEGFVHTSDVVTVDKDGYFTVVDRTKDMIIVSGYKVYSREIDDILYENPAVELAATIGIPDPEREGSERVAVFVKLKDGLEKSVTEDEIKKYLSERVAKYAVPKVVKIVDSIPQTDVHKINKKALREAAAEQFSKQS